MAGTGASGRRVPSLFGEQQSFDIENPPTPFADVHRATGSLRTRRTNSRPAGTFSRESGEQHSPSITDALSPVAVAATAPPIHHPHPDVAPEPTPRSRIRPATDQELNPHRILEQIRRLTRLDDRVFAELIGDPAQTLAAVLIAAVAIVAAAIGGWLWLAIDAQGLSTGAIVLREFFLGSLVLFVLWVAWMSLTRLILIRIFTHDLDAGSLLRVMGFASLPLMTQLFMIITPLAYGIGILSLLAWFGASSVGLRTILPVARVSEILIANAIGFALLILTMSAIADATAMAPGIFAHGADLSKLV